MDVSVPIEVRVWWVTMAPTGCSLPHRLEDDPATFGPLTTNGTDIGTIFQLLLEKSGNLFKLSVVGVVKKSFNQIDIGGIGQQRIDMIVNQDHPVQILSSQWYLRQVFPMHLFILTPLSMLVAPNAVGGEVNAVGIEEFDHFFRVLLAPGSKNVCLIGSSNVMKEFPKSRTKIDVPNVPFVALVGHLVKFDSLLRVFALGKCLRISLSFVARRKPSGVDQCLINIQQNNEIGLDSGGGMANSPPS